MKTVMERKDDALATAAVDALIEQLRLTPKPGLPDARDLEALATRQDLSALRWSAKALAPGLAAMAAAARRIGEPGRALREEIGAIGRATERSARQAGTAHRGALWTLGLLVAAAALEPRAVPRDIMATAKRIAAHPDRRAPRRPSVGSTVSAKYGAAGARGEARAGFPHVRRASEALAKAAVDGPYSRLDALLTVMSTLQDTGLLYTAGPHGLRSVQAGARAVLDAGGSATEEGRAALVEFDTGLRDDGLHPRGSGGLLAGALFLNSLPALPTPA